MDKSGCPLNSKMWVRVPSPLSKFMWCLFFHRKYWQRQHEQDGVHVVCTKCGLIAMQPWIVVFVVVLFLTGYLLKVAGVW